jgi:predicted transcriptional regulator
MRARTVADAGVTATVATGPGVTVTVCVPLVAPVAEAVSTWLPARVSR